MHELHEKIVEKIRPDEQDECFLVAQLVVAKWNQWGSTIVPLGPKAQQVLDRTTFVCSRKLFDKMKREAYETAN